MISMPGLLLHCSRLLSRISCRRYDRISAPHPLIFPIFKGFDSQNGREGMSAPPPNRKSIRNHAVTVRNFSNHGNVAYCTSYVFITGVPTMYLFRILRISG